MPPHTHTTHAINQCSVGEDTYMPQFFQSTKFFAVLDVEEARVLFNETPKVCLRACGGGERLHV